MKPTNDEAVLGGESCLQAARQQSQALAELRAAHPAPFDWEQRRRAGRRLAGHPAWLTAALAAGVLGLATVTLATIHSRRAARRSSPSMQPTGVAAGKRAALPPLKTLRRATRAAVEPQPEQPAPAPRQRSRPARRAESEKPAATVTAAQRGQPPDQVVFEGEEPGTTIIVRPPPRKLGPIWTPDEYKKQRAGQQKF